MHALVAITALLAADALASPVRVRFLIPASAPRSCHGAGLKHLNLHANPIQSIAPKRRASDGGFSLKVVPKELPHKKSGAAVVAKAFRKFKGTRPTPDDGDFDFDHSKFHLDTSEGSVVATPNAFDQEYLAPVWIGGQLLNLDIDTGSSDLWTYSSELTTQQQEGHSVYNPNKSSTAHVLANQTWSILYGDGSGASGNVWTDCVWVGGTIVEGQAVETANKISAGFESDADSDGLMGLGFDSLNSGMSFCLPVHVKR